MLLGPEPSLDAQQAKMNRSTRGQWDWYALHRSRVEQLIVPGAAEGRNAGETPAPLRICVLGAGNCNDLDLRWLTTVYGEVHLVDLDRAAIERGVEGQKRGWKMEDGGWKGEVVVHAPVDLTGVAETVAGWKGRELGVGEVEGVVGRIGETARGRQGETANRRIGDGARGRIGDAATRRHGDGLVESAGLFDLVLSPCVLSQIWVGVRDVLGRGHPGWKKIKAALLRQHLRLMNDLIRPGGRGVMIVDLASTSVVKDLDRARPEEWAGLMKMCVSEGKCFRGLEPVELEKALRGAGVRGEVTVSAPWLWHLGFAKAFLCYGMGWGGGSKFETRNSNGESSSNEQ